MKYAFFLILFSVQLHALGQYKLLFADGMEAGKGAIVEESKLRNSKIVIAIAENGDLLEWSDYLDANPQRVPASLLAEIGFDSWIKKWFGPYFGLSTSAKQYLRADSLAAVFEEKAMEMPMPSSSLVYDSLIYLTWTPDDSVSFWEVEFRNQYDETVGLENVATNRLRVYVTANEKVNVYVRNPRTGEGTGVFVLNGMSEEQRKKIAGGLAQINQLSAEHSISRMLLSAAYFEANGHYTDALSQYVKLLDTHPEHDFAKQLLRWYIFRHAFRPWF